MELPNLEGEMPIPLNSTYGGHGHMIHHHEPPPPAIVVSAAAHNNNHILSSTNGPISATIEDHGNNNHVPFKKMIRYRECLKNHAASMGGNATDGCGEFMPSGEEGSLEALTCSACNCHRNFHRKEIEGEPSSYDCFLSSHLNRVGRKVIVGHHHKSLLGGPETFGYPTEGALIPSRVAPPHHPMIMSYNKGSIPSESDEQEEAGGGGGGGGGVVNRPPHINSHHHLHHLMKKRFRTKFTQEQKEKMLNFAEKVGWKIQKQEEGVVQQFCQEVGVKRRVLKVWMHNNKHNLAKKNIINNNNNINNSVPNDITSPQNHQV